VRRENDEKESGGKEGKKKKNELINCRCQRCSGAVHKGYLEDEGGGGSAKTRRL
jgi:hypothetical protein